MKLSLWLRTLYENRFSVDVPFLVRTITGTVFCTLNSLIAFIERVRFDQRIAKVDPKPPIVILGHWRSGTSYLQKLLSLDPQFIAPTTIQVLYPNTFLSTEKLLKKLFGWCSIEVRPMDNIPVGFDEPLEDELALCVMTGLSQFLGWVFNRSFNRYERYLTFDGVDDKDIARWMDALLKFVQKIVLNHPNRTPVLKSPQHTSRIRHLLKLFPNAKFVHIHRHPIDVFRSMKHTRIKISPWVQLQRFDSSKVEERVIKRYRVMYEAFFDQQSLIPVERFHEIRYKSLVADPINELRQMYKSLNLSGFNTIEPYLREYLDSVLSYKTNMFDDLPDKMKVRLEREWAPMFKVWNYTT